VEFSGGRGDDRHEPVVLSLKPLVVLGHRGALMTKRGKDGNFSATPRLARRQRAEA